MARKKITPMNAPEQHAVLVEAGDAEEAENGGDDEHVVHRQRLLDQIAGVEFETGSGAARPPDPDAEGDGDEHVEAVERQAFLGADLVLVLVQNAQVEDEKGDHDRDERDPEVNGVPRKSPIRATSSESIAGPSP
jgi:hypothetical protein